MRVKCLKGLMKVLLVWSQLYAKRRMQHGLDLDLWKIVSTWLQYHLERMLEMIHQPLTRQSEDVDGIVGLCREYCLNLCHS